MKFLRMRTMKTSIPPFTNLHSFLVILNSRDCIGLVSVTLGLWLVFGRGKSGQTWYEEALGIASIVVGGVVLLCWLIGQLNHDNHPKRAQWQTVHRIFHLITHILLAGINVSLFHY